MYVACPLPAFGAQQTCPQSTQPHPQVAMAHSKESRQPEAFVVPGRKSAAAKPPALLLTSNLVWKQQKQQPGLAPGAIESPAEFPTLETAPKKGKQQPGRKQNRQERLVPSNSIRDLSSKQAKKEEEAKPLDEEVTSGEGESTSKSHEMSEFIPHNLCVRR